MLCLENLRLQFYNQRKSGEGWRPFLSGVGIMLRSSVPPPGWAGEFSCPYMVGKLGFPGDSVVKNPPANVGDMNWIPGSWRSPGVGNVKPLQDSSLENPMDRGNLWATIHGVARVRHNLVTKITTKWSSYVHKLLFYIDTHTHTHTHMKRACPREH